MNTTTTNITDTAAFTSSTTTITVAPITNSIATACKSKGINMKI